MAVSPFVSRSPSAVTTSTTTAAKARGLAVRSSANGQGTVSSPAPAPQAELAEQLNEDVRRKYVKGIPILPKDGIARANKIAEDKKLGEGTYAIVYLGHLRTDPSSLVAIKKIKVNAEYKDGLSMDAIREVKYLQELSHPNIIALHDVF